MSIVTQTESDLKFFDECLEPKELVSPACSAWPTRNPLACARARKQFVDPSFGEGWMVDATPELLGRYRIKLPFSVTPAEAKTSGRKRARATSAFLILYGNETARVRVCDEGWTAMKYVQAPKPRAQRGTPDPLFDPAAARGDSARTVSTPVLLVEGELDAATAYEASDGLGVRVLGFSGCNKLVSHGKLIPQLQPLRGPVYLAFDGDWRTNRRVRQARRQVANLLAQQGAIPMGPEWIGGKGLGDHLAVSGTLEQRRARLEEILAGAAPLCPTMARMGITSPEVTESLCGDGKHRLYYPCPRMPLVGRRGKRRKDGSWSGPQKPLAVIVDWPTGEIRVAVKCFCPFHANMLEEKPWEIQFEGETIDFPGGSTRILHLGEVEMLCRYVASAFHGGSLAALADTRVALPKGGRKSRGENVFPSAVPPLHSEREKKPDCAIEEKRSFPTQEADITIRQSGFSDTEDTIRRSGFSGDLGLFAQVTEEELKERLRMELEIDLANARVGRYQPSMASRRDRGAGVSLY